MFFTYHLSTTVLHLAVSYWASVLVLFVTVNDVTLKCRVKSELGHDLDFLDFDSAWWNVLGLWVHHGRLLRVDHLLLTRHHNHLLLSRLHLHGLLTRVHLHGLLTRVHLHGLLARVHLHGLLARLHLHLLRLRVLNHHRLLSGLDVLFINRLHHSLLHSRLSHLCHLCYNWLYDHDWLGGGFWFGDWWTDYYFQIFGCHPWLFVIFLSSLRKSGLSLQMTAHSIKFNS